MSAQRSSITGTGAALAGVLLAATACAAPATRAAPAAGTDAPCAPVSVISARGTTEPQSGSKLLKPLGTKIVAGSPGATYTELEYPAASGGNPPSADVGVTNLVRLLNSSVQQCPDQKYVLLGYSQGAAVIGDALVAPARRHQGKTAGVVASAAAGKITAVVLFGNPRFNPKEPYDRGSYSRYKYGIINPRPKGDLGAYATRLQDYCNGNDLVCQTFGTWQGHLDYFHNQTRDQGAAFVLAKLTG